MGLDFQIIRDGNIVKTTQLDPGEYILGREGCDIVLDHGSVSKNHAKLSVASESATITDSESLNGTYWLGQKIEKKTFDEGFEVEIGPFLLKGTFPFKPKSAQSLQKGVSKKKNEKITQGIFCKFSIRRLASFNIRLVLFLCLALLMAATFFAVYFSLKGQMKGFQSHELIKRGVILARYLSEINRDSMETGQYDLLRTHPINMEQGVVYSFVIDVTGKILAPVEETGKMLDSPNLGISMKEGRLRVDDGKNNEKVIFYPIKKLNKIIGAAIIGYDIKKAGSISGHDTRVYSFLLFFLLLVLCVILVILLIKVFLKPLQELEEDVGVALKEGRGHLKFDAPYKEIKNLVRVFNRLLMRVPTHETGPAAGPSVSDVKKVVGGTPDSLLSKLDEITSPWCIVDTKQYVIVKHNQSFIELTGNTEIKQGTHVVEAFNNPKIVSAISALIDSLDAEKSMAVNMEKPLEIRKISIKGEENRVAFIFEDSTNG